MKIFLEIKKKEKTKKTQKMYNALLMLFWCGFFFPKNYFFKDLLDKVYKVIWATKVNSWIS
jgi:hypothetical protein